MNKRIFLKSFIILLGLGLLGIGGWFLFIREEEPEPIYKKAAALILSSDLAQKALSDSDGDGLRDWEEALWKTDPNRSDTDNDGYSDYTETSQGYDPTDSSSNPGTGAKAKTTPAGASSPNSDGSDGPVNLTEGFAKTLKTGITDPASITTDDLNNPLAMVDAGTSRGLLDFVSSLRVEIDKSQIKTTNDNSPASIQKYMSDLTKAIPTSPYPNSAEDDILAEAMEMNNFSKINQFIDYFETSIANMKKTTVPSGFTMVHKRETELLMATKKIYESVKEVNSDPLKTVLALQENQKIREEMAGLMEKNFHITANFYE